jgi:hypothetical protein
MLPGTVRRRRVKASRGSLLPGLAAGVTVAAVMVAAWAPSQGASDVALASEGSAAAGAEYWLDVPGTLQLNERAEPSPEEFAGVSVDQTSGTVTVRDAAGSKAATRTRLATTATKLAVGRCR